MIYKKLKQYVPEKFSLVWLGIFLAFVASAFSVTAYYFLYGFLETIIVEKNIEKAIPVSYKIVIFLIMNTVVYFLAVCATHVMAFRLETNLKKKGIEHLMSASFSFYDKNESGRIRKIIDDNTALTHMSVAHLIPDLSTALFTPVLSSVLVFYIDYRLGIFFLCTLIFGLYFIKLMMGDRSFMEKYMQAAEKMNSGAVEYVRGIHVLKIFKTNLASLKDFYNSVMGYSDLAFKYSMSCRKSYVVFQVFFNSIFLAVMFMFYLGADDPMIFLTKFMFYVIFSGVLFIAFMKIMYVGMYVFQASSAIQKIEEVFAAMSDRKLALGREEYMDNFSIEFKDVSFGYENDEVISHLSFQLDEGKTYALVGSSGSGKSTLVKLISGFYDLDEGQILIGGKEISTYSAKALAKNIANVFQDAKLFKKTIYENVLLGRQDATHYEVMEALHQAQCDEIVDKFPERENTLIGSRGIYLSGGEVQRIAIARAILKNAGIVILDEASAAADPENEYELQSALSNLMQGKTVIMIAHRLSSIRNVDEILVVDRGSIIERGSHNKLMSYGSHYQELQRQFASANEWKVKR